MPGNNDLMTLLYFRKNALAFATVSHALDFSLATISIA
jgi:hypothetical protein